MFKFKIKAIGKNPAPRRGIFLKLSAISAVLLSAVCVFVYFNGPKTHYTGFLRLYYNFGYIFTPCPGRTFKYKNEYVEFSYRLKGRKGERHFTESYSRDYEYPDDRIFLINFFQVGVNFLLFESDGKEISYYKKRLKETIETGDYEYCEEREKRSSGVSSLGSTPCDKRTGKVPASIIEKAVKEGLTVDILPWLMREKVDESRLKRVILSGNIRAVIFRDSLYAFLPDGKLFLIDCWSSDVQDNSAVKILSAVIKGTLFPSTSPSRYLPRPVDDKIRDCFRNSALKTLEFRGFKK